MIDGYFEGSLTENQARHETGKESTKECQSRVTIDILPDLALLEIFDFYVDKASIRAWHTLVHVCRKWRDIIFGAPRRLNLRLFCGVKTQVREMLDIWPPLPIVIRPFGIDGWSLKNICTVLEHNDRVRDRICELALGPIPSQRSEQILAAIQRPFPSLTHLELGFLDEPAPVDPDLFLCGSAPHLRTLSLDRIPFPGLPKLLLSATQLVCLRLCGIPDSGYIPPEVMATSLSLLTRLEILEIVFKSPRSRPDRKCPPPKTRTILPVLTRWRFRGASEYLEVLVAHIDAPLLDNLAITFFHQPMFDTTQLTQFISRTPKFKSHDEVRVVLSHRDISATLPQTFSGELKLGVAREQSHRHLSSLVQVCSSSFPRAFFPAVEHLYIFDERIRDLDDDFEISQWLELFRQFTAVKELYLSPGVPQSIALALQELVGERVIEVLPALRTLFFDETCQSELAQESIERFVDARKHAGYPFSVSLGEYYIDD